MGSDVGGPGLLRRPRGDPIQDDQIVPIAPQFRQRRQGNPNEELATELFTCSATMKPAQRGQVIDFSLYRCRKSVGPLLHKNDVAS